MGARSGAFWMGRASRLGQAVQGLEGGCRGEKRPSWHTTQEIRMSWMPNHETSGCPCCFAWPQDSTCPVDIGGHEDKSFLLRWSSPAPRMAHDLVAPMRETPRLFALGVPSLPASAPGERQASGATPAKCEDPQNCPDSGICHLGRLSSIPVPASCALDDFPHQIGLIRHVACARRMVPVSAPR
jgi:hypothetical protein